MLRKGAPYSYITLDLALLHENDKKTSCFSDLLLLVRMLKGGNNFVMELESRHFCSVIT